MVRFHVRSFGFATLILGSGMLLAQEHSPASFPSASSNEIPEGKTVLIRLGQRLETRTARPALQGFFGRGPRRPQRKYDSSR